MSGLFSAPEGRLKDLSGSVAEQQIGNQRRWCLASNIPMGLRGEGLRVGAGVGGGGSHLSPNPRPQHHQQKEILARQFKCDSQYARKCMFSTDRKSMSLNDCGAVKQIGARKQHKIE